MGWCGVVENTQNRRKITKNDPPNVVKVAKMLKMSKMSESVTYVHTYGLADF